jgi:antitoxin FitA
MATLTVRNLEPSVKERLRVRAAKNGRSMEEEVRAILRKASAEEVKPQKGIGTAIHELFAPLGGVELEIPPREPGREPPTFK